MDAIRKQAERLHLSGCTALVRRYSYECSKPLLNLPLTLTLRRSSAVSSRDLTRLVPRAPDRSHVTVVTPADG